MIEFKAEMEQFEQKGEKTGWRYIFIPKELANKIKPDCKRSFRVKGKIDNLEIKGMATLPMGDGDFIIPLNADLRRILKKEVGAVFHALFEEDKDFKIDIPEDLESCLSDEQHLITNFLKQPKSHQNYFINWINQAKTEATRTKRIVMTVDAMNKRQNYGQMIRESKGKF